MRPEIYPNGKNLMKTKRISYKKILFSMCGVTTVNSSAKVSLQFCISSKAAVDGYFILVT